MRYSATTLRGCLVELFARFRHNPVAEAVLDAVTGVEDAETADDSRRQTATPAEGLEKWLSRQRLVVLRLTDPAGLVDAGDGELLRELDKHPLVAEQLARSPLSSGSYRQRLEPGMFGLGGPVGRPITNAASRALYELAPGATGWRYASRLDASEECWALYADRVHIIHDPPRSLDPADPLHRAAARSAAAYLEVALPDAWT